MRSVGNHYRQLRNWRAPLVSAGPLLNLHTYVTNLLRSRAELVAFPLDRDGSADGCGGRGIRRMSSVPARCIRAA